jgi:hypothetical protein
MKYQAITSCIGLYLTSFCIYADQSIYCPVNHAYINVGMTTDQVIAACGQPLSQQDSNEPILQKIPVTQYLYNNLGTDSAFYGVWNIPTGSGGVQLQVDVVNNKVRSFKINGSDNNSISICNETNIQIGDDAGKVLGACGSPSMVNNTYINVPVNTNSKPKVWIYQFNQFQPAVSLTFIDGKLQSIK